MGASTPVVAVDWHQYEAAWQAPADLVAERLAKLVAIGRLFFTTPDEPFRGSVTGRHFQVVRVLGRLLGLPYDYACQPVIEGDVVDAALNLPRSN